MVRKNAHSVQAVNPTPYPIIRANGFYYWRGTSGDMAAVYVNSVRYEARDYAHLLHEERPSEPGDAGWAEIMNKEK